MMEFDEKWTLLDAAEFALKNLEEIAIPMANKLGKVTSMDVSARKLREAIESEKHKSGKFWKILK